MFARALKGSFPLRQMVKVCCVGPATWEGATAAVFDEYDRKLPETVVALGPVHQSCMYHRKVFCWMSLQLLLHNNERA